MSTTSVTAAHHHHHDTEATIVYGFWIYIMSDCILFASLFATFIVLHANTFGGPGPKELFSLPYVLVETFLLLASSFTYGLGLLSAFKQKQAQVIRFLLLTFILGLSFVLMEVNEFAHLVMEGHSWKSNAFLSSFFTLVGTHGFHVTMGLIWMLSMMIQVKRHGLVRITLRKLTTLSLFWHFLDIVWIFVFTIVYLMELI
ncbi:MAG: cytochrome o ubiquinol oxidase subunit III [Gammaproteobacteria bacterium]|nr:cytochrome o ubiquinol oxidase subunit III [Gammaproteobacteria bacterium]MCD8542022.1 cytochrome o ubiquinol oxidase subunit III [Gammaproteobacteria bacterium]